MRESQITIIGGGLAGLVSAIHLQKSGFSVTLIEKNKYPFHRVCGEYISNEVKPYLLQLGIPIHQLDIKSINQFKLTSIHQKSIESSLPLGGFGVSRYTLDHFLFQHAQKLGVHFIFDQVLNYQFTGNQFLIEAKSQQIQSELLICAYGKRSNIDAKLSRKFFKKKTAWMGVKAHYRLDDFPENRVELHNFDGGYCGLSKVDQNYVNCCYLIKTEQFQKYKNFQQLEQEVLAKNTQLADFFQGAKMSFEKRLVISQVSFENKTCVENHALMIGDSAGLIHPLCGNGMAMAIHSAKLASEAIIDFQAHKNRKQMNASFSKAWKNNFSQRLFFGGIFQQVLLQPKLTNLALQLVGKNKFILKQLIQLTHGKTL
ncbi:MAG: NAD(P)/FAD-dependent oxidoreductase [Flavobacteriaceae bacterium]|nr:NAD(P)/FAD-dependent oxidoreductase [Flavobacteriaceae bacterium]